MAIYELDGQGPDLPADGSYLHRRQCCRDRQGAPQDPRRASGSAPVLRGDNEWIEIGEGSNVQDNSTLHVDPGFP